MVGGKMKARGTTYWDSPNVGATDESGFSALPGGYRNFVGSFVNIRGYAFFWSATEFDSVSAWNRNLDFSYSDVYRFINSKSVGASVRCLRD
jgi:uncharacterized protein (TIGR02145 family)